MATPVAHSLLGLAVAAFFPALRQTRWRWMVFAVFAANLPDVDFLPGLFVGDANRYHQGASHSVVAMVSFGVLVALVARHFSPRPRSWGVFGSLVYGTHLVVDVLTYDGRAPYGIPLLWPFSDQTWVLPWTLFRGVRHGVPGDSFQEVLANILSSQNAVVVGVELLVLGPVLLIFFLLRRRGNA